MPSSMTPSHTACCLTSIWLAVRDAVVLNTLSDQDVFRARPFRDRDLRLWRPGGALFRGACQNRPGPARRRMVNLDADRGFNRCGAHGHARAPDLERRVRAD